MWHSSASTKAILTIMSGTDDRESWAEFAIGGSFTDATLPFSMFALYSEMCLVSSRRR